MGKKGKWAIVQAFSKAIIAIGGAIVKFGEDISGGDEGDVPRPAGPDPGPPRDAGVDEAGTGSSPT